MSLETAEPDVLSHEVDILRDLEDAEKRNEEFEQMMKDHSAEEEF